MPDPKNATAPHTLYERASLLATEFAIQHSALLKPAERDWLIKSMVALATDYCKEGIQAERKSIITFVESLPGYADPMDVAAALRNRSTKES